MMATNPPLSGIVLDELQFLGILGIPLGTGWSRVVVEALGYPDSVVKISYRPGNLANWTEWHLWQQIRSEANLAPLFGECRAISVTGKYLLMERLDSLTGTPTPTRVAPPWLTDRKPNAFGANAAGQVKIRDYAAVNLGSALAIPPLLTL